jgi:hypothetical protein
MRWMDFCVAAVALGAGAAMAGVGCKTAKESDSGGECPSGEQSCGGVCQVCCIDTQCGSNAYCCDGDCTPESDTNCGGCGTTCNTSAGESCQSGSCACPDGQQVNTSSDCGSCGTKCTSGEVCTGGTCQCPSGTLDDSNNCGQCGNACPDGEPCVTSQGTAHCSGATDGGSSDSSADAQDSSDDAQDSASTSGLTISSPTGAFASFTLTTFTCTFMDSSEGSTVTAPLTAAQAALLSIPPSDSGICAVVLYSYGPQVDCPNVDYQYPGSSTFVIGTTGTLPSTTLTGLSGVTGTIVLAGSWDCP